MRVSRDTLKLITDVEVEGINHRDHPDYVDAFISSATWKDTLEPLSEDELDVLNDKYNDFVYDCVIEHIY